MMLSSLAALLRVSVGAKLAGNADLDKLEESLNAADVAIESAMGSIGEFRESIAGLPPMSTKLIRAKQHAVRTLDRLVDQFATGRSLNADTLALIQGIRAQQ